MKPTPEHRFRTHKIILNSLAIFLLILTSACGSQPDEKTTTDMGGDTSTSGQTDNGTASNTTDSSGGETDSTGDPALIEAAWQGSPHADTFVLNDAGENSTCARCHAPVNFIPTMDDLAEECYACKFEIDPPPPLISQEDWVAIPCQVCHQVDKGDDIQPEIAWLLIPQIEDYAEVASATELCLKCHAGIDLPDHQAIQLVGSHAQDDCTLCHDAHDTTASCTSSGCHDDVTDPVEPIAGHDDNHANVSCVACHDGSGMQVDVVEGEEAWSTMLVMEVEGETTSIKFTSHNIALEASCDRCHYADNPWDLLFPVESP